MAREVVANILRFVIFLLLQGLLFNYIDLFGGLAIPFPYIFAMLMLPFNTPKWAFVFIGFFYGLAMDIFTDTLGIHTSACVFLGFVQPFVTRLIPVKEHFGVVDSPTVASRGSQWYLTYSSILVLLHHIWLFAIEWFKFTNLHWLLLKILLSSAFTLIIMLLFQFLLYTRVRIK